MPKEEPRTKESVLTIRLFPADSVMWVVSMPCGVAAETAWPGMAWVEALASVEDGVDDTREAVGVQPVSASDV